MPAAPISPIDDFNTNWAFDRAPHEFVGGYNVGRRLQTPPLPIGYRPVAVRHPRSGAANGSALPAKWYQTAMVISASGSVMANRYNCFDLDPTYRNAFGPNPLMRMTFDYKANEHKMGRPTRRRRSTNHCQLHEPRTQAQSGAGRATDPWTVVPYQSTQQYRRHDHGRQFRVTAP